MTLPILYSFRRCPYAMRARMGLLVSETLCEIREVALRAKPDDLIAVSPKATVPVLVLSDGRVIDQSLDILRWALARHDPEDWLAGDDTALIAGNDGTFKHHLDRYKYPDRHGSDPLDHRVAAVAWLMTLEHRLANRANVCGERRQLADIAIFPFVRQFAAVEPDWFAAQQLPGVRAWLDRHLSAPLFARAMTKLAPWRAGMYVILGDNTSS
ncbi:glutathione S-transferase [Sphingomonas sp. GC_Shp_3]|uniref:glutathione S-transferase n=1 Tax=Sphingomonas sp. GC_Shp_3 TaxID=2937383 RepID=UPI002269AB3C|nr:glutathione S-transferase [Sphingomonas sp. GC_Shp_3]